MRRLPLILVSAFALLAPAVRADDTPRPRPEAVGLSAEKLRRLDEALLQTVEKKQLAGVTAVVVRKGQVGYLHNVGVADLDGKRPMTPTTIVRIASMTKPITSVAALILVDDGKLALDDAVAKFIPEFKNPKVLVPNKDNADGHSLVPAARDITVRDLLTHTSGLIYPFPNPAVPKPLIDLYVKEKINFGLSPTTETLAENIKRLGALPLAHQPGAAFTYGLSTDVLGRVVEAASGKTLDEFCRERIFQPLKMDDTSFAPAKEKADRLATLYRSVDGKLTKVDEFLSADKPNAYFSGGAALWSTARDYGRFLQMLVDKGQLGEVRVLKAETVKAMTTNQIGDKKLFTQAHGDAFGLGVGVVTPKWEGKSKMPVGCYGWAGAFATFFWVDPNKDLYGVLMTQLAPGSNAQLKLWEDFPRLTYEALAE